MVRLLESVPVPVRDWGKHRIYERVQARTAGRLPTPADAESYLTALLAANNWKLERSLQECERVFVRAAFRAEYEGTTYYFCGEGCRRRFLKDPAAALAATR